MKTWKNIVLGVLQSDIFKYKSVVCSDNQITSYCYLTN